MSVPERIIQDLERLRLDHHGVRIGDPMVFIPFQGKKKLLTLQRPLLEFKTCSPQQESSPPSSQLPSPLGSIVLPGFPGQNFNFQLALCPAGDSGEKGRFLMKSRNGGPFCINGTLSFESFVERGDKVQLGYNTLLFPHLPQSLPLSGEGNGEGKDWEGDEGLWFYRPLFRSHLNILLEGETGTGKTRLGKLIHEESGRQGNFVHINVSSFSTSLLESELFGHKKGAFTGALWDKKGAFLEAQGGTLFLDEVDSLPREVQTKLLLFLESREVRPVGGDKNIFCDVRLIFAAGKRLKGLVEKGEVRADFFYRISSGAVLFLPSLRNNPKGIGKICQDFAWKEDLILGPRLVEFYQTLPWPGNIRQLLSHLKKKKILRKGRRLEFDYFDEELLNQGTHLMERDKEATFVDMDELKFRYVLRAYHFFSGDVNRAAEVLNITSHTVKSILRKGHAQLPEELRPKTSA